MSAVKELQESCNQEIIHDLIMRQKKHWAEEHANMFLLSALLAHDEAIAGQYDRKRSLHFVPAPEGRKPDGFHKNNFLCQVLHFTVVFTPLSWSIL